MLLLAVELCEGVLDGVGAGLPDAVAEGDAVVLCDGVTDDA